MLPLSNSEYSVYKRNGDFAFILSCNRRKIVTDDFGNEIVVPSTSPDGIFTEFKGFMTLEYTPDEIPMDFRGDIGNHTALLPFRYTLKFPQHGNTAGSSFREAEDTNTDTWRKQHYTFSGGSMYSVTRFHGTVLLSSLDEGANDNFSQPYGFSVNDNINIPYNQDPFFNTGVIQTNDDATITGNTQYQMVSNSVAAGGNKLLFGANWLNLSIHLPQVGFLANGYAYAKHWRSNSNFTTQYTHNTFYYDDNRQVIADGKINTKWFARSDLHWTDFIYVPKTDILKMADPGVGKGFTNGTIAGLTGKYRNGTYLPSATPAIYNNWNAPCPLNGGKVSGLPSNGPDDTYYFYKGFKTADCVDWVISLGLV
jgi:hypothetical protein